jgi:hypothetical protein
MLSISFSNFFSIDSGLLQEERHLPHPAWQDGNAKPGADCGAPSVRRSPRRRRLLGESRDRRGGAKDHRWHARVRRGDARDHRWYDRILRGDARDRRGHVRDRRGDARDHRDDPRSKRTLLYLREHGGRITGHSLGLKFLCRDT